MTSTLLVLLGKIRGVSEVRKTNRIDLVTEQDSQSSLVGLVQYRVLSISRIHAVAHDESVLLHLGKKSARSKFSESWEFASFWEVCGLDIEPEWKLTKNDPLLPGNVRRRATIRDARRATLILENGI
jgi:hypothetical protein